MPYASVADVQQLRPSLPISNNTRPSYQQVVGLLDRLQADIDGRLSSLGFVVPVLGAESVKYLRTALAFGVSGAIEDGQGVEEGPPAEPRPMPKGDDGPPTATVAVPTKRGPCQHTVKYEAMLAAVAERTSILLDATRTTNESLSGAQGRPTIQSYFTQHRDGSAGIALTGSARPRFRMDQEF